LGKAEYKVKDGKLIRVQLVKKENRIEKVKITGDFFLHPEELIEELEQALAGRELDESNLAKSIRIVIEQKGATLLGASPEDFTRCIVMAGEKDD